MHLSFDRATRERETARVERSPRDIKIPRGGILYCKRELITWHNARGIPINMTKRGVRESPTFLDSRSVKRRFVFPAQERPLRKVRSARFDLTRNQEVLEDEEEEEEERLINSSGALNPARLGYQLERTQSRAGTTLVRKDRPRCYSSR